MYKALWIWTIFETRKLTIWIDTINDFSELIFVKCFKYEKHFRRDINIVININP